MGLPTLIDAIIIVLLLFGIGVGINRGFFKSTLMLVGTIVIFIISYFLKNPLANLFYNIFPFIDFEVSKNSVIVLNILFYEGLAFLLCVAILSTILKILIKFTSIFESILNATIIFGALSKVLGGIVGFLQFYILIFVLLYFFNNPIFNIQITTQSVIGAKILQSTPILSKSFKNGITAAKDITILNEKYKNDKNSDEYNREAINIMLKNDVIKPNSLDTLIKKDKLKINGIEPIIEKYRKRDKK